MIILFFFDQVYSNNLQFKSTDSLVTFRCDTCSLVLDSKFNYDMHIIGQKHKKKLNEPPKSKPDIKCEICNIQVPDKVFISFLNKSNKFKFNLFKF